MTDLEVIIVFFTTLFFTLLYLMKKELLFGFLTFPLWWIMGLTWLLIDPTGSSAWSISWIFHGIGWIFFILVLIQTFQIVWQQRHEIEESELD